MTDERIDELLYKTRLDICPDEVLKHKTKRMIMTNGTGKEIKMKKYRIKKTIVITAACCLLFSTVVIASTRIIKYSVSHSINGEYKNYEDLTKAEERAGISIKAPEKFKNGYTFKEAGVVESEERGENDEVISKYNEIKIAYTKFGEDMIAVYAKPKQFFTIGDPERYANKTEIDGIDVYYFVTAYKCVTPDYKLTDEDIRRQEEEGLQISVGASKNYETQVCNCMWVQDGVGYDMLCTKSAVPDEKMFEMAAEIIHN
jgi:hypothetical protein